MAGERILVVDDDAVMGQLIGRQLQKHHYQITSAGSGREALAELKVNNPDLIILDIMLPDVDGFELCQEIRKTTNVPIIFLTSKSDRADMILGLGVGGDDYMVKPPHPGELLARVKAQLRRFRLLNTINKEEKDQLLRFPGLTIDLAGHMAYVGEKQVPMTGKEFELLVLLARNPNRVFHFDQLLDLVWQSPYSYDNRTVMVHISKLRKKIEPDPANPQYIQTVRGVGYKFSVNPLEE